MEQYEEAVDTYSRNWFPNAMGLALAAAGYIAANDPERAAESVVALQKLAPGITADMVLMIDSYKDPKKNQALKTLMSEAGLD